MMGTSPAQRLRLQLVAADFLERMGQRLRERREEMKLSRADVARKMPGKVSENQVYRWELGKHQPNPDTLQALAGVLERDVGYFMAAPADKTETPDLSVVNGDRDQLERIETQLRANAEAIRALSDQLQEMQAETVDRAGAVLQRIAEAEQAILRALPPQRRAKPA